MVMTAPALHWKDDEIPPEFEGSSVDPVTAWMMLTRQAQSETWREETFLTVLDTHPALQEEDFGKLQALVSPLGARTPEGKANLCKTVAQHTGITAPRVFSLPLHRRSLPESVFKDPDYAKGLMVLPVSGPLPLPPERIGPMPEVIVGIIDYAINPVHARFQHGHGEKRRSRIAYYWLQDGAHGAPEVPFGFELNGAEINEALTKAGGDEEAALRALGLLRFGGAAKDGHLPPKTELARRLSHGTHVLDLAAGRDPSDPEGMGVQIVAVALPDAVRRETSGRTLALFFLQGLEFILRRSCDIQKKHDRKALPVLICASLGITGGPRKGRHLIEKAADALLARHGNASLYLPSGNSNLARGHAVSPPGDGAAVLDVPWRLQPGDESPNHLEAWIAHPKENPPDTVSLTLTPPGSWAPPGRLELAPGKAQLLTRGSAGEVIGRAQLEVMPEGPMRLSVTLAGTDPAATGLPAAPAGAWRVEISAPAPATEVCAWLLRDDDPVEHSGNVRQSYFDALDYVERDRRGGLKVADPDPPVSAVRRAGTLNAIATSTRHEAVGGFVQPVPDGAGETLVSKAARYAGTPLPAGRELAQEERVAWAAPCDSSPALRGVLAAGTRSGSLVAMDGTSVAAPQIVRLQVALRLYEIKGTPETLGMVSDKELRPPIGTRPVLTPLALSRLDARAGRGAPRV
jgi:hypothetical protein